MSQQADQAADRLGNLLAAKLSRDDANDIMDALAALIDAKIDDAISDHARRYNHDSNLNYGDY